MTKKGLAAARRAAKGCGMTTEEFLKVTRKLVHGNGVVYRQLVIARLRAAS